MDAPLMYETIRVCKPILGGDLTGIEKKARSHCFWLTSLRNFKRSLKHLIKTLSEEATGNTMAPAGLLRDDDGWMSSILSSSPEESMYRGS